MAHKMFPVQWVTCVIWAKLLMYKEPLWPALPTTSRGWRKRSWQRLWSGHFPLARALGYYILPPLACSPALFIVLSCLCSAAAQGWPLSSVCSWRGSGLIQCGNMFTADLWVVAIWLLNSNPPQRSCVTSWDQKEKVCILLSLSVLFLS